MTNPIRQRYPSVYSTAHLREFVSSLRILLASLAVHHARSRFYSCPHEPDNASAIAASPRIVYAIRAVYDELRGAVSRRSAWKESSMRLARIVLLVRRAVAVRRALAGAAPRRRQEQPPAHRRAGAERHPPGRATTCSTSRSARGTWDDMAEYPGGVTALCTLALLNSGVEPDASQDPEVARLPPRPQARQDLHRLAANDGPVPPASRAATCRSSRRTPTGSQRVQINAGRPRRLLVLRRAAIGGDNSNSQFAVLALHEAERVGAQVDPQSLAARRRLLDSRMPEPRRLVGLPARLPRLRQHDRRGHRRLGHLLGSASPTPAARIDDGVAQCCLPPDAGRRARARRRVDGPQLFRAPQSRAGRRRHVAPLLSLRPGARRPAHGPPLPRRARLVPRRRRVSRQPARSLQPPLAWAAATPRTSRTSPPSLALLFLSKGRRPVLDGQAEARARRRLEQPPQRHGQPHRAAPSSSGASTSPGRSSTRRPPTVEDLLQAPVLFLTGSKRPELDGLEAKMRDYIDRGGFLFAEACCVDGSEFDAGFREFLDRVFPEGEYKLRRAGPEHPIWRIDRLVRPDSPYVGRLWTVEYGCRTCVVFSEVDLSCYWELYGHGRRDELPEPVQAADRRRQRRSASTCWPTPPTASRRARRQSFVATDAPELDALGGRGVIRIAKLIHGGGCNDAPGALVNLLRTASQGELKLQVSTTQFDLLAERPQPARSSTWRSCTAGTTSASRPRSGRTCASIWHNGGTLFADAICASKEFAAAFRREMQLVLPDHKLERIPADHPLFTDAAGGFDIRQVEPPRAGRRAGGPAAARRACSAWRRSWRASRSTAAWR